MSVRRLARGRSLADRVRTGSSPTRTPVLISGPCVSSAIAMGRPSSGESSCDLRVFAMTSPWYSYEPWEKFMRTTFIPALRSSVSISGDFVFGPIVQMMEHWRCADGSE